jgi:hypothetical protein
MLGFTPFRVSIRGMSGKCLSAPDRPHATAPSARRPALDSGL